MFIKTRSKSSFFQVQVNHFEDFFSPELDKHGYQALYKKRTTEVTSSFFYLVNLIWYLLLSCLILLLCCHRCILEILWPQMAVLLFSAETSFHTLKNTRYDHFWVCSYWLVCTNLILALVQVEFNKAAQSLTDAIIPAAQKRVALSRLIKVRETMKHYFICPVISSIYEF